MCNTHIAGSHWGVVDCYHATDDTAVFTCLSATADPFQDVGDPTVRVAMALGMDPRRLAIYNRHQGGDTCSAVAALRFALQHPLSDLQAAAGQPPHHTQTTRSVAAKQQQKFKRGPLLRVATPPDFRMKQVGQHHSYCLVCWTGHLGFATDCRSLWCTSAWLKHRLSVLASETTNLTCLSLQRCGASMKVACTVNSLPSCPPHPTESTVW